MSVDEPVKPSGEEIETNTGYPYYEKKKYYVVRGYYYDSKEQFDGFWDDMLQKRAVCKEYAEKVKKCMELEQTCAIIYGYYNTSEESIKAAKKNILDAVQTTREAVETNLEEAAQELDSFRQTLQDLNGSLSDPISIIENINDNLKKAGEHFTEKHNEAYPLYSSACSTVHIGPDKFMEG